MVPRAALLLAPAAAAAAEVPTRATTARPVELSAALRTSVTQRSYVQKASAKVQFRETEAYALGTGDPAVCGKVTRHDGFDFFFVRFALASGRTAHRETLFGYHAVLACRNAPAGQILTAAP